nr:thiamine-phosphate kinase [Candidatus Sigynarchaeota archaeon]
MKIEDLGEKKLIERIFNIVKMKNSSQLARFDDVFLLEGGMVKNIILNTDMMVGETDIPEQMNYFEIGRKSVINASSDLVVKGVTPRALICSMGLPRNIDVDDFDDMIKGIDSVCKTYGIQYIGGDINEANDIIMDVTVIGYQTGPLIPRKGIRPGDIVTVTGEFGFTRAGLHLLLEHKSKRYNARYQRMIDSVLQPGLEFETIESIARHEGVVASIDSSDGLAASVLDLMDVNEVGFLIDSLPVNPSILSFSEEHDIHLIELLF